MRGGRLLVVGVPNVYALSGKVTPAERVVGRASVGGYRIYMNIYL